MSVPIAVVGLMPKISTSSGVMIEPPPMPVRPTRKPTPKPKRMIAGSMGIRAGGRPVGRGPLSHLVPFDDRFSLKGSGDRSGPPRVPLIGAECGLLQGLPGHPGALVPGQLEDAVR